MASIFLLNTNNLNIWLIGGTLIGTTIPGKMDLEVINNEGALHIS